MTTDEDLLKEMLDRATNPAKDTVDELSVQMFCMVVRSDVQLIGKSLELILNKVRAVNVTEAIRAIALLEECMTQCGSDFQDIVDTYRFLNGLIRLVSINYDGAKTPVAIKKRILECLLLWTTEFPQKIKIQDAYKMLNKQMGDSEQALSNESTLGIDGQKLQKLLQSGDPENLKRANLLIQRGVRQDARRIELTLQHKSEIDEVQTKVTLLNQMLDSYESEGSNTNEDNLNLIRELYLSCKKHKPVVMRLPELLDNTENELLSEALVTSDMVQDVLKRYKQTIVHPVKSGTSEVAANSSSKLNTDLVTGMPSDLSAINAGVIAVPTVVAKTNPLDELTEIFGTESVSTKAAAETSPLELLGSFDFLNVDPIFPTAPNVSTTQVPAAQPISEKRPFRDLPEIDKLSEELFQMSLPAVERINSFKKEPEKLTLNDLAKERIVEATSTPNNMADKNINKKPPGTGQSALDSLSTTKNASADDQDVMMLSNAPETTIESTVEGVAAAEKLHGSISTLSNELPLKHLSDIDVSLDDVVPTAEERLLLDDDDVKITLNFAENRPSRHVSVVVISVLNKSKMPITDFQFEASVKKPSKVRLLPPTAFTMSPYKPFRPPTPINQVMLLLNPTGKAIDITCIVGYISGDDPDPVKESLVAKDIPYVD